MKIKKYLQEANYNDQSSTFAFNKYKFTKNTQFSFDNDLKVTLSQLESVRDFLRNGGHTKPDKNIISLLGSILKHFSSVVPLMENFPDLKLNSDFPKDV